MQIKLTKKLQKKSLLYFNLISNSLKLDNYFTKKMIYQQFFNLYLEFTMVTDIKDYCYSL